MKATDTVDRAAPPGGSLEEKGMSVSFFLSHLSQRGCPTFIRVSMEEVIIAPEEV